MTRGWLLYDWAIVNDPINRFGGLKMKHSPSASEADKLLTEIKKYNNIK
jgi:hypothetical protein